MKRILVGLVALCALNQVALGDHKQLETLARSTGILSTQLSHGARSLIGPYPTYPQRYAYEHIEFLHRSAHRLEAVLKAGRAEKDNDRDHAHDERIRRAYDRLSHDAYFARETFDDLLVRTDGNRDHAAFDQLNGQMFQLEAYVREMHYHLP